MLIVFSAALIGLAAWLIWWAGRATEDATATRRRLAAVEITQDENEKTKQRRFQG